MKIDAVELLHRHNLYGERPVLRLRLEMSASESDKSVAEEVGSRLRETLAESLGALADEPAAWDLGSLVGWAASALQRSLGVEVDPLAPSAGEPEAVAAFECEEPRVGLLAGRLAVRLTRRLLRPGRGRGAKDRREMQTQVAQFCRRAAAWTLPAQDREVVRAARARGIEVLPLAHRLLQLGQGRFRQRIYGSSTSRLDHLSTVLAANKDYSKQLLADLGLPVARYERVRGPLQAVAAAERIGYPVVIKPNKSNMGRGVSIGVRNAEEVVEACKIAQEQGRSILVEEQIEGQDHRLLVIDGKVVAASLRMPAHVVGDGRRSVADLAAAANDDPRRRAGQQGAWTALVVDATAQRLLERQGLAPDSIAPAGERVYLRAVANTSSGGTAVDITDDVHPENLHIAERAAVALGMDIAGVDILAPNLTRPVSETGGVICEINSKPGLRKHLWPAVGTPRDVIGPLLDMLFPKREHERFQTVTLVAEEESQVVAELLCRLLERVGRSIVAPAPQASVPARSSGTSQRQGPAAAARRAFLDPLADGAVLRTRPDDLIAEGLGYSGCSVGAWIGPFRACEGEPAAPRATALRLLASATRGSLVLDADDPDALELARTGAARPTCLVMTDPSATTVRSHLDRGVALVVSASTAGAAGRAASCADIAIYQNGRQDQLEARELASLTPALDVSPRQAASVVAILLGLGMRSAEIREALRRPALRSGG